MAIGLAACVPAGMLLATTAPYPPPPDGPDPGGGGASNEPDFIPPLFVGDRDVAIGDIITLSTLQDPDAGYTWHFRCSGHTAMKLMEDANGFDYMIRVCANEIGSHDYRVTVRLPVGHREYPEGAVGVSAWETVTTHGPDDIHYPRTLMLSGGPPDYAGTLVFTWRWGGRPIGGCIDGVEAWERIQRDYLYAGQRPEDPPRYVGWDSGWTKGTFPEFYFRSPSIHDHKLRRFPWQFAAHDADGKVRDDIVHQIRFVLPACAGDRHFEGTFREKTVKSGNTYKIETS